MATVYQTIDELLISVQSAPFGSNDVTVFTKQPAQRFQQIFCDVQENGMKHSKQVFSEMKEDMPLFIAQSNVDETEFITVSERGELSYVDALGNSLFSYNKLNAAGEFKPTCCQLLLLPEDDEGLLLLGRNTVFFLRISSFEDGKQVVSTEVPVEQQKGATLVCASCTASTVTVIWSNGVVQQVSLESKKCVTLAQLNCEKIGSGFAIKVLPNGKYTIVASHQRENNYNVIRITVWSSDFSLLLHLSEIKSAETVIQIEWVKSKFALVAFPTSLVHVPISTPQINLALQMKQRVLTDMYLKKPVEKEAHSVHIVVERATSLEAEWDKAVQTTEKGTVAWQTHISKKGLTDSAALVLIKENLSMLKRLPELAKPFVNQCLTCNFWASLSYLVQNRVLNADLLTEEVLVSLYKLKKYDIICNIVQSVTHLTESKIVALVHLVLTQPFKHCDGLKSISMAKKLSSVDFLLGTLLGYGLHNDIALAKSLLIMSIDEVAETLHFLNAQLELVPLQKEFVNLENISMWTRALVTAHFRTILANRQSSNAITELVQIRGKITSLTKHMREVSLLAAKVKAVLNTPIEAMPKHKDTVKLSNYSVRTITL